MAQKVDILGIMIDKLSKKKLQSTILCSLEDNKRAVIFTPNPEIVLNASKDIKIKEIINRADICIPDGVGVVVASRLLGTPLPERLAGIETGEFVLEYASKKGLSVFLLGGKENIAKAAKSELEKKYKSLNICGTHNGFFDVNGKENEDVLQQINLCSPDIIFVCMGFPRQEAWICENADKISSLRLAMGLGGSLDVWSGKVRRAPLIFRKLSLEWLWRMIREPRRAKILVDIPLFMWKIIAQKLSERHRKALKNGENAHKF